MDFETWLAGQSEDVQGMIAGHVQGLSSALASERDARKQLATELKTAVSSSGQDGDMKARLEQIQVDLAGATERANFFAAGHKAGIANLPLAYLAAKEGNFIGVDGTDFEGMGSAYPELFGGAEPETIVLGNGGNGRDGGSPPAAGATMDDLIRKEIGIG